MSLDDKLPYSLTKIFVRAYYTDYVAHWYSKPDGRYCKAFLWVPSYKIAYAWLTNKMMSQIVRVEFPVSSEKHMWKIFRQCLHGEIYINIFGINDFNLKDDEYIIDTNLRYISADRS